MEALERGIKDMRLEEGKLLGDWKLIKEIGKSAIGRSIVAEHRFTKQKVILKVLPEELASDRSFISRFEEEVIVLSSLDHPHIAKIHTVSFIEGLYLLIVECVVNQNQEIVTIQDYLRDNKYTHSQVLRLGEQLADALDYAHTFKTMRSLGKIQSFSHGNIQPSSVHLSFSDGILENSSLTVKFSDFGLSRIVGQATWLAKTYKSIIDGIHEVKGSLPSIRNGRSLEESFEKNTQSFLFLSPEQRRGDWSTPHESDIWSFGVLLYWIATGGRYPEGAWNRMQNGVSKEYESIIAIVEQCVKFQPQDRPKLLAPLIREIYKQKESRFHDGAVAQSSHLHPLPLPEASVDLLVMSTQLEQKTVLMKQPSPTVESLVSTVSLEEGSAKTIKEYIPEKRDVQDIQPIYTEMVVISQDSYFRGSNQGCRDELPRHEVRLPGFQIDIHPVTNEQFSRFLEFIGDEKDKNYHDIIRLRDSRIKKSSGKFIIERGYAKHPVVGVTWYGAFAYANWIGKRLPTEAEWEVACCGGLENPTYPTGESIERSQANFFSSDTTAVMSYPANGYGLYDIVGNVYEWCQDWYEYSYYDFSVMEPDNPKGPIQGVYRVLRGGCWKSLKEDLRCAKRHRNNPGTANGTYGFRCAADIHGVNSGK